MRIDIKEIENRLNIRIPRDLMIFEFIDFGDLKEIAIPDTEYNFCSYSFEDTIQKFDYSIVVEYFISNKLLEATWVNNDGSSLRIAKLKEPYGAYIHISIVEEDYGTVWLEWGDLGDPDDRVKLAEGLLEFLSKLKKGINMDMIEEEFSPPEQYLFKNWGEKYWRIRENEKE